MQTNFPPTLTAPQVTGHPQGLPGEQPETRAQTKVQPIANARNPEARLNDGLEPTKFWRAAIGQPDPSTNAPPPSIMQITISRLLDAQNPDFDIPESDTTTNAQTVEPPGLAALCGQGHVRGRPRHSRSIGRTERRAQVGLQHLAVVVLRQRRQHHIGLWPFETRNSGEAMRIQRGLVQRAFADDKGYHLFAPFGVRTSDHGDFGHLRVFQQRLFNLARVDIGPPEMIRSLDRSFIVT